MRRKDPVIGRKFNFLIFSFDKWPDITEIRVKILPLLRKKKEGFQIPYACASEDSHVKPGPRVFFGFL